MNTVLRIPTFEIKLPNPPASGIAFDKPPPYSCVHASGSFPSYSHIKSSTAVSLLALLAGCSFHSIKLFHQSKSDVSLFNIFQGGSQ